MTSDDNKSIATDGMRLWAPLVALAVWGIGVSHSIATEPTEGGSSGERTSFSRQIAPILATHCVSCHGPKAPESDYQVHTFARLMKDGASGEAPIAAGKPDASYLFELVTSDDADLRMPKEGKPLSADEIEQIKRWISEGARFDGPDAAAPIESYLPKRAHPSPPQVYPRPVPVTALAFSPDGAVLASGGYYEVLVWSVATGAGGPVSGSDGRGFALGSLQLTRRITNIAQRTHAIAFSPDGSLLAIAAGTPGRGGEVKLFHAQTGELVSELGTMSDEMFDVEFSRDGTRLAACGADRTIRIYDVAERKEKRKIEVHADWVMAIAWSPDGSKLASASRDKTAKIIDATTGTVLVTYPGHDEQVFDVVFSPDGQQVFSAGRGREVHRWSADGKSTSKSDVRKKETGAIIGQTRGEIYKLALHGSHVLAASADGKLSEFDPAQMDAREPVQIYEGAPPQSFSVAIDDATKRIAVGGFDGRVTMYAIGDSAPWQVFVAAPSGPTPHLATEVQAGSQ